MVICICSLICVCNCDRLAVKRKPKKEKAAKDPNKPKKPASAFFIFMYASIQLALISAFLFTVFWCILFESICVSGRVIELSSRKIILEMQIRLLVL